MSMAHHRWLLSAALALSLGPASPAQVVLSEFMASNGSTLQDEDGAYSDWIEIQNTSTGAVNLAGWYLTDAGGNLTKWRFPDTPLAGGGFVIVFASNKNRAVSGRELHTNFKLDAGGEFLALVEPDGTTVATRYAPTYLPQAEDIAYGLVLNPVIEPVIAAGAAARYHSPADDALGTSWRLPEFDDSGWSAGATGLGFDSTTNAQPFIATDVSAQMAGPSLYLRQPFVLNAVSGVSALQVQARYNDGFVAWINGSEVARTNAPTTPAWDSYATAPHAATAWEIFPVANPSGPLVVGTNILAIQVLNVSPHSMDLLMAPVLAGDVGTNPPAFAPAYLTTPTPASINGGGLPVLGPGLRAVTDYAPAFVPGASLVVTARVEATLYPVSAVRLCSRRMFDGETILNLNDSGVDGDAAGGDGVYSGTLATTNVAAGQMLRWRFEAVDSHGQSTRLPAYLDPFDSPQYCGTVALDTAIVSRLPVVHWFIQSPSSADTALGTRCSVWFLDRFYDNVQVTQHGQSTLGFIKGSYNFDFNRGARFAYREGAKPAKDIDLLTNWADKSKCRNTLAYGFFADSGHPAHFGFPVRVQQNGAFFSVADMVEDADDVFLDRVGLDPDGALYKLYNGLTSAMVGVEKKTRRDEANSDLQALIAGLSNPAGAAAMRYAYDHTELPRTVHYLAMQAIVNNTDHGHKNYYLYCDTDGGGIWTILPQDVDLTYGHVWTGGYFDDTIYTASSIIYATANNPYYQVVYQHPELRAMVMRRVRTLVDEYLKPAGSPTNALYFEPRLAALAEQIDPDPGISDADLDRAKWGTWGNGDTMRQGVVRIVDQYLPGRRNYLGTTLSVANGGEIPDSQPPDARLRFGAIEFLPGNGAEDQQYVEVINTNAYDLDISGWTLGGGVSHTFYAGTVLAPGQSLFVSPSVREFRRRAVSPTTNENRYVQGNFKGRLSPRGEALELRNRAGVVVDAVTYVGYTNAYGGALSISEVMYAPADGDSEFLELHNGGASAASLSGLLLMGGISFDFRESATPVLPPDGYAVLVRSLSAFTNRYGGAAALVAGVYTGALANAGDSLTLVSRGDEAVVADCTYGDGRGWPASVDGAGHSLVPLAMTHQDDGRLDYGGNWRASAFRGGSPGQPDPPPPRDVVLNEIIAHTDYTNAGHPEYDSNDQIEIYHAGGAPVSLEHWYLSDSASNLKKWALPAAPALNGGEWRVFDEVSGFHAPITAGFGLNKGGESLYLSHLPGTAADRVADSVRYKAQENECSLGRHGDGGAWWYAQLRTPGGANGLPLQDVVIDELMYHPAPTVSKPDDNTRDEFVELLNPRTNAVILMGEAGPWRLDGAVTFTFPSNLVMAAAERLVLVGFDPAADAAACGAFLQQHGLTNGQIRLLGPWQGQLGNHGERVALERPLLPDVENEAVSWVIVDEVLYFDRDPWPAEADGTGMSLQRQWAGQSGNDPANWLAALFPTPGLPGAKVALSEPRAGAVYFVPSEVILRARLDESQVAGPVEQVAFLDGSNLLGTATSAPYTCSVALTAPARLALRAELRDASGVATSGVVRIDAMAVDNLPVEEFSADAATLRGTLLGAGVADVGLCWGEADGGTNAERWAHVETCGTQSGGVFSARVGPLNPNWTYWYRAFARRGTPMAWAPATGSFRTSAYTNWTRQVSICLPGFTEADDLAGFPVLVSVSTNMAGFSYADVGGSWASLRFLDDAGRLLVYEPQRWDTNGFSQFWVRLALLTNGACLRAIWGNPAATSPPPYTTDGSVWRDDFVGVWHLEPDLVDASGYYGAVANAGAVAAAGLVAGGLQFADTNAVVDPHVPLAWYVGARNHFTLSFWANVAAETYGGTPFGAQSTGMNFYVSMNINPRVAKWQANLGTADWAIDPYRTNGWQLVTVVLSNGVAYGSVDNGPRRRLGDVPDFRPALAPVLGRRQGGGSPFSGRLDELRLSAVVRPAAWSRAEYAMLMNAATFSQYGTVADWVPALDDGDGDGVPDNWERAYFGSTNAPAGDPNDDWDGDGLANGAEYTAGTDPTNGADFLRLDLVWSNEQAWIRLPTRIATATYHAGRSRFYRLEETTNLLTGGWGGLPGLTNVPASGFPLLLVTNGPGPRAFRGSARLQ